MVPPLGTISSTKSICCSHVSAVDYIMDYMKSLARPLVPTPLEIRLKPLLVLFCFLNTTSLSKIVWNLWICGTSS